MLSLKKMYEYLLGGNVSGKNGKIRVSGRDTFDYICGDYRSTVYVELLTGHIKRRICVWSIRKWLPPHDAEQMTQEEKDEILRCLCEYFAKRRIAYDLLEGAPSVSIL